VTDQDERRTAVDAAYRDHADDVYRVALAILRDPESAADATHDAFARAFERWGQYDSTRSLTAWLHGIVSHAALDDLRRRRVRRLATVAISQIGPVSTGGSWAADPSKGFADRDQVAGVLAELKPEVRAALVLRHYYGYDYAEIAGFLRTSPGNVGSILSRAHATLRARLTTDAAPVDPAISKRAAQ
jgi:RNA polymerase sigma-70 factor (ECF subfamily)